jgi:tRNA nucleotidyltransferase (CCA-adding enzyme)
MKALLAALRYLFPAHCHDHIYLVGGSVRDFLLDKESEDIDLAAALPDETLKSCGFYPVAGKTTAPIWFQSHQKLGKIEVIQLKENSLDADLRRRDFAINAIAMHLSGELYDPLGGSQDLRQGLLRVCSDTTFADDPLRIFRAFRFEADGWQMTAETGELIRSSDWNALLGVIPVERFSREMLKALAGKEPWIFFQRMLEYRVGEGWLPELFSMPKIPAGPLDKHPEGDLFIHAIEVLQRTAAVTENPLARFCAFFHDIGKLATEPAHYPKHHGHEEAGFDLGRKLARRLCLPAAYIKGLSWISRLHMYLNRWDELRIATRIRVAEQAEKAGITHILPVVAWADKPPNTTPPGWQAAVKVAAMTTAELGIDLEKLTVMPVENRAPYILQRRVEMLRSLHRRTVQPTPEDPNY